ncbi:MAG TPA: hypothetical protein PKV86_10770, partial [Syntrophobacteraceae bacterium]|nr:hypothetical protein [Syntrophobacteraceae bacterium]
HGALNVMPVKTGIQELRGLLDTGFRRYDVCGCFSDGLVFGAGQDSCWDPDVRIPAGGYESKSTNKP